MYCSWQDLFLQSSTLNGFFLYLVLQLLQILSILVSINFFNTIKSDFTFGTAGIKDDEFSTNIQRLPMDNCISNPAIFVQKNDHYTKLLNSMKVHLSC